ncbi:Hypothetical predicted protein [Olea europaea subsp. europaea]|uniref:Uncharacterized protein n=1 Tax=Olea europaea subsp. europaea TaxID=158383 RepID=A0A8S0S5A9_OLEEU|nr:Hypothetical predicted protein [Olea europaea subsp. europaea]
MAHIGWRSSQQRCFSEPLADGAAQIVIALLADGATLLQWRRSSYSDAGDDE